MYVLYVQLELYMYIDSIYNYTLELPRTSQLHCKQCMQTGGWWLRPIEPGSSDRLPSHPKQKMVEPQAAVSPLLGLSVAYW